MDLSIYYEEICRQPLLSREEERRLLNIYFGEEYSESQKKQARQTILSANLRFVFKKAKSFAKGDPYLFEELIGAGNEGLIVGLEKYDPNSSVRFLTYAGWWVIQRQLKEMSKVRLVQLPIWKQQLSSRILKAQEAANHPLSIEELQQLFPDAKEKDLVELSGTRYLTFYFEDMVEDDQSAEDGLTSDSLNEEVDVEGVLEEIFQQADVNKLLSLLPEVQASVIKLAFGLHDGKERSSSFISEYMELSRDEVRRLKKDALKHLQRLAINPSPAEEP